MFFYLKKHRYGRFVVLCLLLGLLTGCSVPTHSKSGQPMDQLQSDPSEVPSATDLVPVENPEDVRIFEQQFGHYRGADLYGLSGRHLFVSRDDESFTTEHWDGQDAVSQILHPDMYILSQTSDWEFYYIWFEVTNLGRASFFIAIDPREKEGFLITLAVKTIEDEGRYRSIVHFNDEQYQYYSEILPQLFLLLGEEEQDLGGYFDGVIAGLYQARDGVYAHYEIGGIELWKHPVSAWIFKRLLADTPLDLQSISRWLYRERNQE